MQKKVCSECSHPKLVTQFNFRNKVEGTRHSYCRECSKAKLKRHYENNKAYYSQKARRRERLVKKELRDFIVRFLREHPCVDCGETDIVVLQFDHVRAKKEKAVSELLRRGCCLETVKAEIEKCDVRCGNCHLRKTAKERGFYRVLTPEGSKPSLKQGI